MNRVVLVGRLTKDPELRTTGSGSAFAMFTIAVNRTYTSSNGEKETDFINCIVFNKQAENLTRYIKKGGLIGVDGRIQTRNYVAQDGTKRFVTEVICENIHFLEPKNGSQGAPNTNRNQFEGYDPSPYEFNNQPSYQNNNSNYNNNKNNYNNNYANNRTQPSASQAPRNDNKKDPFDQIQNQFDITDDDLPF